MMRGASVDEWDEGKNTIGRTAAVLNKPYKATFTFYLTSKFVGIGLSSYKKINLPDRGLKKVEKHWSRKLHWSRSLYFTHSNVASIWFFFYCQRYVLSNIFDLHSVTLMTTGKIHKLW